MSFSIFCLQIQFVPELGVEYLRIPSCGLLQSHIHNRHNSAKCLNAQCLNAYRAVCLIHMLCLWAAYILVPTIAQQDAIIWPASLQKYHYRTVQALMSVATNRQSHLLVEYQNICMRLYGVPVYTLSPIRKYAGIT